MKCYECYGKCNKKGYPSVTKQSKYCMEQRKLLGSNRKSIWKKFTNKLSTLKVDLLQKGKKLRGFR